MRYVAVLESPVAGLAEWVRCFTSDLCRVTELNGRWVLDSSSFDGCSSPSEVFPLADAMLLTVRRIVSLYHGLSYPPTVAFIQCIDEAGQVCSRTVRGSLTMKITSPTAMSELTKQVSDQPLATAIWESTLTDPAIREALTLYQDFEDRWADVYDILEFLGGPDQIEQSGFGAGNVASVVKRTANYYRHLGRQNSRPLPSNPPTLPEAALFAKRALRLWIEARLWRPEPRKPVQATRPESDKTDTRKR
jgi:hypothetical protein